MQVREKLVLCNIKLLCLSPYNKCNVACAVKTFSQFSSLNKNNLSFKQPYNIDIAKNILKNGRIV